MKLKIKNIAAQKIRMLVDSFATEVEWHGFVTRIDDGFELEDVAVFPHKATGATVISDQKAYEEWLDSLSDEQFSKCRFHGHSHVNMPTTPSGFDMEYRSKMISGMPKGSSDDTFYIFAIFNKRNEHTCTVYDIENDKVYTNDEVEFEYEKPEEIDLEEFRKNAHDIVEVTEAHSCSSCEMYGIQDIMFESDANDIFEYAHYLADIIMTEDEETATTAAEELWLLREENYIEPEQEL